MKRFLTVLLLTGTAAAHAQEPAVFSARAYTEPAAVVAVRARVDGYVKRCAVGVGSAVDAGAVLVEIAVPELDAEAARAEAALARAEAHLEVLASDREIARRRLAISRRDERLAAEELARAERAVAVSKQALERAQSLVEAGVASSEQVVAKRTALLEGEAAFASAGEQVKNAQDRIEIAGLEAERTDRVIAEARREADVKRAELELARARAGHGIVRNQMPGAMVSRVLVTEGDLVRAGETTLLELMDVSRTRIVVHVPQEHVDRIDVGTPATISGAGKPLRATVHRRSGFLDPKTGTMRFEIEIPNDGGRWVPGRLCSVQLELAKEGR